MCRRRNFLEEIFSSVAWIFLFTDKSDSTLKTAVIQKSATIEVEYYQKQTYKHTIFKDKKKETWNGHKREQLCYKMRVWATFWLKLRTKLYFVGTCKVVFVLRR